MANQKKKINKIRVAYMGDLTHYNKIKKETKQYNRNNPGFQVDLKFTPLDIILLNGKQTKYDAIFVDNDKLNAITEVIGGLEDKIAKNNSIYFVVDPNQTRLSYNATAYDSEGKVNTIQHIGIDNYNPTKKVVYKMKSNKNVNEITKERMNFGKKIYEYENVLSLYQMLARTK